MASPLSTVSASSPRQAHTEYADGLEAYIPGTQDYYDQEWSTTGRESGFDHFAPRGSAQAYGQGPESSIPATYGAFTPTRSATEYGSGLESFTPSSDLKEVHNPAGGKEVYHPGAEMEAYTARGGAPLQEARIFGLRRRAFWIVLAIVLIVVIATAVGGGVGGTLANRHNDDSDASSNGGSSGSLVDAMSILPSTSLAAVNFTDQYGYDNLLVFYQLRSLALAQSAFNSSTGRWSTSLVNNNTDAIKNGTALSASIFWRSKESRDTRVYYTSPDDKIYGLVVGGQGLATAEASWSPVAGVSGNFVAAPNSRLVSSGKENADSYEGDFLMYQDMSGVIRVQRRENKNDGNNGGKAGQWSSSNVPFGLGRATNGSGMALIPIYNTGLRALKLFYSNETSGKTLAHAKLMHNTAWTGESLPTGLDEGATLTAFSWGYNSTEVQDKKPRGRSRRNLVGAKSNATVHVLTLKTGRNVQLTAFSGGQWSFKGDVPGIRKRGQTPGVIAASQAGRIYGVVSSGSGDGVEIVEWKWKSGEEYEEVGVVDAAIA